MIIPVRCVTCGFPFLAHRWEAYEERVKEYRKQMGMPADAPTNEMSYAVKDTTVKTPNGKALDDLGITKMCCRRHMLSHVDLL